MRRLRGALLAACLALGSCFEPPVREELRLDFLANGAFVVTAEVEVRSRTASGNPALERRLAEVQRAIAEGWDPWTPRFAGLEPAAERFFWEKRLGEIARAWRSAAVTEPEALPRFFADSGVDAFYAVDAERGLAELALRPGPSTRATRRERRMVESSLEAWAQAIAAYLAAGQALYGYLEDAPERERACFGALFSEALAEEVRDALPAATQEEQELVERLGEAMLTVMEVLRVPEGEDHSLDELSRLVYDPFPAHLVVGLPGPPLEAEGFDAGAEATTLEVGGLGLWASLARLEGRWLFPDPAVAYLAVDGGAGELPFDLDAFLARPRRTAPPELLPGPEAVREALEQGLEPAPVYRAVWTVRPEEEPQLPWRDPG